MMPSEMIVCLSQLILLSSFASALEELSHVIGKFGTQRVPIDFWFGDNVMVVTTHKPVNAPDTFRETSNLHIFSRRMVAIRNSLDSECYVQPFNATMSGMKERVENAVKHNGDIGSVKEERVMVGGVQPLRSESVELFLGPEIAKFCHLHQVYILSDENVRLLDPEEVFQKSRRRRYLSQRDYRWRPRVDIIDDGNYGNGPLRDLFVVC